ncbi:FAS1-like dehydratase domain-containing protein [Rubrimonas cliftonensis]|uniref:3-methylfumaryl-CoA hydratase n=1 Tax=Rubrimonas cliftonensis TaxID=89524 RepID=A0A1H3X3H3_9RHOB|nr:MaoC family dehydratase N-terminal domain-containing protein [Rubrimonas cliftonensis]SDZ93184.1 3-methylfumaryl-CoA hydratase [Rubrimonas cliftonensis]
MTVTDAELQGYEAYVGREARDACVIAPESCDLMAATLDRDDPRYAPGDPLPPMWIWMGFRPHARRSQIGHDGHPARGDFLPPVALPRRMFAGARHRFLAPLPCGETIERVQRIKAVTPKRGASGAMVFVTVAQSFVVDGVTRMEEEQDIVYREAATPGEAPPPAASKPAPQAPWSETYHPDVVTLLRYSALTFNGHRIHYDRPYATQEEGYPGLIVHGPLTATLLADLCRRRSGRDFLAAWEFRARKPLFDVNPITLTGTPAADGLSVDLAAYDHEGFAALTATAIFEAAT